MQWKENDQCWNPVNGERMQFKHKQSHSKHTDPHRHCLALWCWCSAPLSPYITAVPKMENLCQNTGGIHRRPPCSTSTAPHSSLHCVLENSSLIDFFLFFGNGVCNPARLPRPGGPHVGHSPADLASSWGPLEPRIDMTAPGVWADLT